MCSYIFFFFLLATFFKCAYLFVKVLFSFSVYFVSFSLHFGFSVHSFTFLRSFRWFNCIFEQCERMKQKRKFVLFCYSCKTHNLFSSWSAAVLLAVFYISFVLIWFFSCCCCCCFCWIWLKSYATQKFTCSAFGLVPHVYEMHCKSNEKYINIDIQMKWCSFVFFIFSLLLFFKFSLCK